MCDNDLGEGGKGFSPGWERGCAAENTALPAKCFPRTFLHSVHDEIRSEDKAWKQKFLGGKRNRKTKQHGNFLLVKRGNSMCGLAPPAILRVYSDF